MSTIQEKGSFVMSGMSNRILRSKMRTFAWFWVLAIAATLLAGCATGAKHTSVSEVQEPPAVKGPTVAQLGDGREGFVITEVPRMDEASRRDFELAVARLNEQDYSKAIDLLKKVIEGSPKATAPYIDIAIAYEHIGEPEQAEADLKTALTLVPAHPAASNEYGLLCRKAGRFAEARKVYEKALARFPDYYPIHRNLGILCDLYLNDPESALKHYEIYSEAKPEDRQVKLWIADLRARLAKESKPLP
jgi:tetratricopeptide (TPR) repeat protein